jgi:uncharacterized protein (DUF362 family)
MAETSGLVAANEPLRYNPSTTGTSRNRPAGPASIVYSTARGLWVGTRTKAKQADAQAGRRLPTKRRSATPSAGRAAPAASVRVSLMQGLGAQPLALLGQALEAAGFWRHIEQTRRSARLRRTQFRIAIKPDLDFYDPRTPGGTDPALVEHLVDLLHDNGFTNVAVIDGRNDPDAWLHNRDALVVPELVGYRFATTKGRHYEIVGFDDRSAVPARPADSPATPINAHWADAGYRINFAKNKTHEDSVFALCVHNLAGVTATRNARGAPRRRSLPEDCLEVLRRAPPHFNVIDGYSSSHGGAGHRAPRAMQTHTFITSPDALLADWAGAAKMGVDPYASPVNALALRAVGLPARYEIDGDLGPYPLWRNVHPLIAHSARLRNGSDALGQIAGAWFQSIDRERFPLKDFYNDRINSFVAPLMTRLDDNPRSFWAVVLLNYFIARIDSAIGAQHTMFSKDKLRRRVAPLTIDPADYDRADYESIADYLRPYELLLEGAPPSRLGLRWRVVDGSVLFSCSHVFPIAFESFVAAVDITRSIQYMNDYIGGATVAVRRDGRRRTVQQAERNLYLQQPNWMVLFGGEVIDVEKLQSIRYENDRQVIYWRTVRSANDSARFDDGSVSFTRTSAGETTVRVFARQQFALPLFFKVFDVNLAPGIRDPIVESAYTTFFEGTMANLQAAYDGRDFRIGHDLQATSETDATGTRDLPRYLATAAAAVAELLRHRGDVSDLWQWLFGGATPAPGAAPRPQATDRDGFRHFEATAAGTKQGGTRGDEQAIVAGLAALARDAPDFLTGLVDAMHKDLDRMANPPAADPVRP